MNFWKTWPVFFLFVFLIFSCNLPIGNDNSGNLTKPLEESIIGYDLLLSSEEIENVRASYSTDEELRTFAQRVLPPLLCGSYLYLHTDDSIHVNFSFNSYSDIDDISLLITFCKKWDDNEVSKTAEVYEIPSAAISYNGYSGYELYKGSEIYEYSYKVNFDLTGVDLENLTEYNSEIGYTISINNRKLQEPMGTQYGYNWKDRYVAMYLPLISTSNRMESNTHVEEENSQSDFMRYMEFDTSETYSHYNCGPSSSISYSYSTDALKLIWDDEWNDSEIEDLRYNAQQVMAPLLFSSNTSLTNVGIKLDFSVISYAALDNVSFQVVLYDSDFQQVKTISISDTSVSVSEGIFGIGGIYYTSSSSTSPAGVQDINQNLFSISESISLTTDEIYDLSEVFFYRVFIINDTLQDDLTLNNIDFSDKGFAVFIPCLKSENIGTDNEQVTNDIQAINQRYIRVLSQLDYKTLDSNNPILTGRSDDDWINYDLFSTSEEYNQGDIIPIEFNIDFDTELDEEYIANSDMYSNYFWDDNPSIIIYLAYNNSEVEYFDLISWGGYEVESYLIDQTDNFVLDYVDFTDGNPFATQFDEIFCTILNYIQEWVDIIALPNPITLMATGASAISDYSQQQQAFSNFQGDGYDIVVLRLPEPPVLHFTDPNIKFYLRVKDEISTPLGLMVRYKKPTRSGAYHIVWHTLPFNL